MFGIISLRTNKDQLLQRIQRVWTFTNLQYFDYTCICNISQTVKTVKIGKNIYIIYYTILLLIIKPTYYPNKNSSIWFYFFIHHLGVQKKLIIRYLNDKSFRIKFSTFG